MGTHPSLPSHIASNQSSTSSSKQSLSAYLNSNPSLLGSKVLSRYGTGLQDPSDFSNGASSSKKREKDTGALPFLFKILSVGKALSIQAHPDKKLAERLHKEMPDVYKGEHALRRSGRQSWFCDLCFFVSFLSPCSLSCLDFLN